MTEDRKLLVEEGNAGSAYLAGIPGQEVSDAYAKQFENGSDFFEDVKRHVEPAHNIAVSHHENVGAGSTNVGKKGKEHPEPSTGVAKGLDETKAGFSNVGKKSDAEPKEKVTVKSSKGGK